MILKNETNQYYTRPLFQEEARTIAIDLRPVPAIFSLYHDYDGLINFGRVYVSLNDPSGYEVAKELLNGDYRHWQVLMKCKWFQDAKAVWDEELDAKLVSEAMATVREIASDTSNKGALAAAKFIAQKQYKDKDALVGRGRPSKEEVEGNLKRLTAEERAVQEDAARVVPFRGR